MPVQQQLQQQQPSCSEITVAQPPPSLDQMLTLQKIFAEYPFGRNTLTNYCFPCGAGQELVGHASDQTFSLRMQYMNNWSEVRRCHRVHYLPRGSNSRMRTSIKR